MIFKPGDIIGAKQALLLSIVSSMGQQYITAKGEEFIIDSKFGQCLFIINPVLYPTVMLWITLDQLEELEGLPPSISAADIKPGYDIIMNGRGVDTCNHKFAHYEGLSESFYYCTVCDLKRK